LELSVLACTGLGPLESTGATGAAGDTLETSIGRIPFVGPTMTGFKSRQHEMNR